VLAAAPAGDTVEGEKVQLSPSGCPEQLKLTVWPKPFCGVTVSVLVADCPDLTVTLAGEADSVNDGDGRLMV